MRLTYHIKRLEEKQAKEKEELYERLNQFIDREVKKKNINKAKMAKDLGVSRSAMYQLERCSLELIQKVEDYINNY